VIQPQDIFTRFNWFSQDCSHPQTARWAPTIIDFGLSYGYEHVVTTVDSFVAAGTSQLTRPKKWTPESEASGQTESQKADQQRERRNKENAVEAPGAAAAKAASASPTGSGDASHDNDSDDGGDDDRTRARLEYSSSNRQWQCREEES
jgi:hypothetical protein